MDNPCEKCSRETRASCLGKNFWSLECKGEPFINKPCISTGTCHEDKVKALCKVKEDINKLTYGVDDLLTRDEVFAIIDKYIAESEDNK